MTGQAQASGASGGRGWRIAVWGGAAALMLAAALATRLSNEMAWDSGDFILVGLLLLAACGAWELAMRTTRNWTYSAAALVAAGTAFLLFLVNAAVGFLGSEDDPVNLIFFGVATVLAGGAVIVRAQPEGMARTLAVTAATQVAAGLAGLALIPDVRGFVAGTALFVPLWLLSAWLFARSARV